MIDIENRIGPEHLLRCLGDDGRHVLRLLRVLGQVTIRVLDEDDRAVEEDAEVDRPQREEVRRDARVIQTDERRKERQRHRDRDGEGSAECAQKEPQNERHERGTLEHVVRNGRERRVDQARAVVERRDGHPFGEDVVVDSVDVLVDAVEHVARVLTASQQDRAFDRVIGVAARHRAAPRRVALDDAGDVSDEDRRAVLDRDDGVLDVLGRLQVAARPDHELALAER